MSPIDCKSDEPAAPLRIEMKSQTINTPGQVNESKLNVPSMTNLTAGDLDHTIKLNRHAVYCICDLCVPYSYPIGFYTCTCPMCDHIGSHLDSETPARRHNRLCRCNNFSACSTFPHLPNMGHWIYCTCDNCTRSAMNIYNICSCPICNPDTYVTRMRRIYENTSR